MRARAYGRVARHPVATGRRLATRLAADPGLPVGRTASMRRLLRRALTGQGRALVLGPASPVRQALSSATLDVVGTDPHDPRVNVVSAGLGAGSLPRRWHCIVVTEPEPTDERVRAALHACRSGGVVALFNRSGEAPRLEPGARVRSRSTRRGLHLLLVEVTE